MSSDQEGSSSSNALSPQESPYSSPSQQVPQLTNILTQLKCVDNISTTSRKDSKPYLKIVEQPQDHFRFRYRSEMLGTHGCIFGRSHTTNKTKTHPTVELVNYTGPVVIRCCLAQKNFEEHPHQLFEESRVKESDELPIKNRYKVAFPDMGVIHNSKKEVKDWLFKKYSDDFKNSGTSFNAQQLRAHCDNVVKEIDMNIVRLKFSAHDSKTGLEICEPVFSDPIHNMKSAATNDLKICRLSRTKGSPRGGDDVIMLCEKVNKKNIKVRFFQMENGVRTWTDMGAFMPIDVHHQYAIQFRTPPYKDEKIESNVKVYIELYRPSDERNSDPMEFTYTAQTIYKYGKKRRAESSSHSSLSSSTGGSIKSLSELPTIVANHTSLNEPRENQENITFSPEQTYQINLVQPQPCSTGDLLGDALHLELGSTQNVTRMWPNLNITNVPTSNLDLPYVQQPPELKITSDDFERLLKDPNTSEEDTRRVLNFTDWNEYMRSYSLGEGPSIGTEYVPDSARLNFTEPQSGFGGETSEKVQQNVPEDETEYNAFYTAEDGLEVKQIVKELVRVIRTKTGYTKQEVRQKLERLFQLRLSNGDTILHMALCNNQPSTLDIVKMINTMKMTHLLNCSNKSMQTALHLAVANDMPEHVSFLVSNGCNPMLMDNEGNNAIHYAVILNCCLEPLLNAIKCNKIECDLNVQNHELNTPLHLSTKYKSKNNTKMLLANGANYKATDGQNRTALHLAAYDGRIEVLRVLLEYVQPCDIDMVDGRGITALQIVCGKQMTESSVEMVELLLQKKADPYKHDGNSGSAWKLAQDKPMLQKVMKKYVQEIKSENESKTASENVNQKCLQGLNLYISEVSRILDAGSSIFHLASELGLDAPLCGSEGVSPTTRLLRRIEESNKELTSASLANILEKLGELEAANIIRKLVLSK